MSSRHSGFYRLGVGQRRRVLGRDDLSFSAIDPGGLSLEAADSMIENVIGVYGLPFAVAVNFVVDGTDVLVPMAIEEPSVVAAASNAARMARPQGFTTQISAPVMIGQIQVTHVADVDAGAARLREITPELLAAARALVPRLTDRGGGPRTLVPRILARSGEDGGVIVAHLHVDCRDAMGANVVNALCEALADRVAAVCGGRPGLRILSNLTEDRTVTVRCRIDDAQLAGPGRGETGSSTRGSDVRKAIAAASRFAELDPYRAATHNKGIMNGVDAVLLATGQDWRAVEAGAHAYAARTGSYRPLAVWREVDHPPHSLSGSAAHPGQAGVCDPPPHSLSGSAERLGQAGGCAAGLEGELVMPLAVGTVGGVLHNHPAARLALDLAQIAHADRLAAVAGAAGLATNFAALRALATEGIQRGHMALHARGLARAAGATGDLVEQVAAELAASGDVKLDRAHGVLARLKVEGKGP